MLGRDHGGRWPGYSVVTPTLHLGASSLWPHWSCPGFALVAAHARFSGGVCCALLLMWAGKESPCTCWPPSCGAWPPRGVFPAWPPALFSPNLGQPGAWDIRCGSLPVTNPQNSRPDISQSLPVSLGVLGGTHPLRLPKVADLWLFFFF